MKKTLNLLILAVLAFGLFACGEKKLSKEDLKKAESTLFNEDGSLDTLVAPGVAEKYCQFVEENPNDSSAAMWLYHAIELNVLLKNQDKSEELCNQLLEKYPNSKWAPRSLYLLGAFVYEDQLKDLDRARSNYDRILKDYPDSDIVPSVEASIRFLGMSPDEVYSAISQWPED